VQIENLGIFLESTNNEFENEGVLNPGCITDAEGKTHLLYRAVKKGNYSSIGYCQIDGDKILSRMDHPLLKSEFSYESHGMEDPRIIKIEDEYYLFYTAYDGKNVYTAYASGPDVFNLKKQGIISPEITYEEALELIPKFYLSEKYMQYGKHYEQVISSDILLWEKDTFLFPKKIDGKFVLFVRIMPGIQMMTFESFDQLTVDFWKDFIRNLGDHILMEPKYWFENRKIGPGAPPIETEDGWIFIYHAVETSMIGNIYRAGAALLDKTNPRKVIARLPNPLFEPEDGWEKSGEVSNVVFPTGTQLKGNDLYIYYGAADSKIGVKKVNLKELLAELKKYPEN